MKLFGGYHIVAADFGETRDHIKFVYNAISIVIEEVKDFFNGLGVLLASRNFRARRFRGFFATPAYAFYLFLFN